MRITNVAANPAFQARLKPNNTVISMVDRMNNYERSLMSAYLKELATHHKDDVIEWTTYEEDNKGHYGVGFINNTTGVKGKTFATVDWNGVTTVFLNGLRAVASEGSDYCKRLFGPNYKAQIEDMLYGETKETVKTENATIAQCKAEIEDMLYDETKETAKTENATTAQSKPVTKPAKATKSSNYNKTNTNATAPSELKRGFDGTTEYMSDILGEDDSNSSNKSANKNSDNSKIYGDGSYEYYKDIVE